MGDFAEEINSKFTSEKVKALLNIKYTASWLDQDANYKYEGGMDLILDKENFAISSFYLWSNSESLSEGKVTLSEKTRIRGKEGSLIPMVYSDDVFCYHQVEGSEVCPAIGSYTYEYNMYPGESYEQKNTLVSYSCLEDAEVIFYWANRPLGILGGKYKTNIFRLSPEQPTTTIDFNVKLSDPDGFPGLF